MSTFQISQSDIVTRSNAIWSSMLGIELLPSLNDQTTRLNSGQMVSACVTIFGEWEGAVCLDMSMELVREAAAVFLDIVPAGVAADQIRDTAGELANMTAGSIKSLLPKPCKISLPSIATGRDFQLTIPRSTRVLRSQFENASGTLAINIFERMGNTESSNCRPEINHAGSNERRV